MATASPSAAAGASTMDALMGGAGSGAGVGAARAKPGKAQHKASSPAHIILPTCLFTLPLFLTSNFFAQKMGDVPPIFFCQCCIGGAYGL
ncbi:MAG: hypothetical protein RSA89_02845 [Raoultibacter sp.]